MKREDRAGLYITVIFHLVVIIVLLVAQIGATLRGENSFVLDFTKEEQREQEKKETVFKEDISRQIDELLAASGSGMLPVRNVTVDRGNLKDDRGTDAEKLYKDAEDLKQALEKGFEAPQDDYEVPVNEPEKKESKQKSDRPYQGPSVVSYELDGRKASHLPIPAYKCIGAGMVTVIITVDNSGKVISAKVQDDVSSQDKCLRDYAVNAALKSRFSSSTTASPKQIGNIVYQFVAQ